jgi:ligand-binding sensor domain-containing protein/two-component sensor histidine kinase
MCLVCLLSIGPLAHSQQAGHVYFNHLLPSNGLSQATNEYFYRDTRGFFWCSSLDGLNRFDGKKVKIYRPEGHLNSLQGLNIQSTFFEDESTGDLWFCTYEALHRYRRASDDFEYKQLTINGKTIKEDYCLIGFDAQKACWVRVGGHSKGILYRFLPQSDQWIPICEAPGEKLLPLIDDSGVLQYLYAYSEGNTGLNLIQKQENGSFVSQPVPLHLSVEATSPPINHLVLDSKTGNAVWVVTPKGLLYYTLNVLSHDFYPAPAGVVLRHGIWTNPHTLLCTTFGQGLWTFDHSNRTFRLFANNNESTHSLLNNIGKRLYLDQDSIVWINHPGKGFSFARLGQQKVVVTQVPQLAPETAKLSFLTSLNEGKEGQININTRNIGQISFKNETIFKEKGANLLQEGVCVAQQTTDGYGNEWLLKDWKVLVRPVAQKGFERPIQPDTRFFLHLFPLKAGGCLAASDSGFYLFEKNAYGLFSAQRPPAFKHLENKYIPFFFCDKKGNTYINVNYADMMLQTVGGQVFTLPFKNIKAVCEDPRQPDIVWIASEHGFFRFNPQTLAYQHFGVDRRWPSQCCYSILPDDLGHFWISTNKGIVRYTPANDQVWCLSSSDGIWEEEFYTNVWLKTSTGRIAMGNRTAINWIDPAQLCISNMRPKVQITRILVNDAPIENNINPLEASVFEFSYFENTLSFDFANMDLSDPGSTQMQYQMEGVDPDWVLLDAGTPGFARYAQLPPGQYRLRIRAANSDGVWNPQAKEISITIRPPFWQTTWFRAVALFLLLCTGYALYRYRLAQVQREAALQLDMAESEMKALRAQLNPHFVFNNLNTVRAYLLRQDIDGANAYLSSFARLMRAILESSLHHTVPLAEELDLLRAYVSTESKHLAHPLHYVENTPPGLDPYDIQVPGMLLQPFVENAIVHGLKPKKAPGTITVAAALSENHLLLSVEDDGVGRRGAPSHTEKTHISRALQIIHERLRYYDIRHGTTSTLNIIDLSDAQGTGQGTRVEIRLGFRRMQSV